MLEYADRVFKQKERLKKQTERIRAQKMRKSGVEERKIKGQKERTLKQQGEAIERVSGARRRGETVTVVDTLEGKKVAHELRWGEKWNRRRAKWDARARKYACR